MKRGGAIRPAFAVLWSFLALPSTILRTVFVGWLRCNKRFPALPTDLQGIVFIRQRQENQQLDVQQKGMEIPDQGGFFRNSK